MPTFLSSLARRSYWLLYIVYRTVSLAFSLLLCSRSWGCRAGLSLEDGAPWVGWGARVHVGTLCPHPAHVTMASLKAVCAAGTYVSIGQGWTLVVPFCWAPLPEGWEDDTGGCESCEGSTSILQPRPWGHLGGEGRCELFIVAGSGEVLHGGQDMVKSPASQPVAKQIQEVPVQVPLGSPVASCSLPLPGLVPGLLNLSNLWCPWGGPQPDTCIWSAGLALPPPPQSWRCRWGTLSSDQS